MAGFLDLGFGFRIVHGGLQLWVLGLSFGLRIEGLGFRAFLVLGILVFRGFRIGFYG